MKTADSSILMENVSSLKMMQENNFYLQMDKGETFDDYC